MPAASGANGTVQSTTANAQGRSATVHFTDPPPDGRNEVYLGLTQDQFIAFNSALPKVDVTCDQSGTVTAVVSGTVISDGLLRMSSTAASTCRT